MKNTQTFIDNFMKTLDCSKLTRENGLRLIKTLVENDPENLTTFEVSFKIKNGRIPKELRFLNFDASAYSSSSSAGFLKRLDLFREIMSGKIKNNNLNKVFQALEEVALTPVDLYFGADVKENNYLFAFWLIFGGVKKDGKVEFWPYDTARVIKKILKRIGGEIPQLKSDILNFGLDIENKELFFKYIGFIIFLKMEYCLVSPLLLK